MRGFTLVEVVVVVAILAILAGVLVPLTNRLETADKLARVRTKLLKIERALDEYFYDNATYPATLSNSGFLGPYLSPGVDEEAIRDDFAQYGGAFIAATDYQFVYDKNTTTKPYYAGAISRGPNGVQDVSFSAVTGIPTCDIGSDCDDTWIQSWSYAPGRLRTRLKLDIVGAALARFLYDAGNTHALTGTWTGAGNDREDMLLLGEFDADGFGANFISTAAPGSGSAFDDAMIYSKGPDNTDNDGASSTDDITF